MKKLAGVAVMALAAAYCIDRWDTYGGNIVHHIAIIDDLKLAMAAYEAACKWWPGETITLRQGARIIKANRVKH